MADYEKFIVWAEKQYGFKFQDIKTKDEMEEKIKKITDDYGKQINTDPSTGEKYHRTESGKYIIDKLFDKSTHQPIKEDTEPYQVWEELITKEEEADKKAKEESRKEFEKSMTEQKMNKLKEDSYSWEELERQGKPQAMLADGKFRINEFDHLAEEQERLKEEREDYLNKTEKINKPLTEQLKAFELERLKGMPSLKEGATGKITKNQIWTALRISDYGSTKERDDRVDELYRSLPYAKKKK